MPNGRTRLIGGALLVGAALALTAGLAGPAATQGPGEQPPAAAGLRADDCATEPDVNDPDGPAGQLKFSTATLSVSEADAERVLLVLRTGGSDGPVSARVRTEDGTATAGEDYTPVDTIVSFVDGDATVQLVRVPVVPDTVHEADETLSVIIDSPVCATLGAITALTLTIVNDDAVPTFALGGTVNGLVGSGLVLRTNLFEDIGPVNGAFVFPRGLVAGAPYQVSVLTQPGNPSQTCTVANGSGIMPPGDVLNVVVDCATAVGQPGLDTSFGAQGLVTTPGVRGARAVVVQPDGKIVTAGDNSLVRYLSDGSPDVDFGAGGVVTTPVDAAFLGEAIDVALTADGSIIVVGVIDNRTGSREDFAVQRYDSRGVLDGSFGSGGTVTTDFNGGSDRAYAVAVQPDGAILVAGHAAGPGGFGSDFAVARYTPAGVPDQSFDGDGRVVTDIAGAADFGHAMVLQPDGKAVVAGRVSSDGGTGEDFGLVRYTTTGALDPDFDGDGMAVVDFGGGSIAKGVTLDEQGRIVVVGNGPNGTLTGGSDFAVARLNPAGSLDPSFSDDGLVTTDFGSVDGSTHNDFAADVLVQPDGSIQVVGSTQFPGSADVAVARYRTDGSLDGAFGAAGRLTVDFHGGFDAGSDLVRQGSDGRVLIAGSAGNGFAVENALARLLP